jgi:hypothetical protein
MWYDAFLIPDSIYPISVMQCFYVYVKYVVTEEGLFRFCRSLYTSQMASLAWKPYLAFRSLFWNITISPSSFTLNSKKLILSIGAPQTSHGQLVDDAAVYLLGIIFDISKYQSEHLQACRFTAYLAWKKLEWSQLHGDRDPERRS